jgi:predicted DNA-binding ribbon-helix-helix protein
MGLRRNKRKSKKGKCVKTSVYLEEELWKELKWEAIQKRTTLSELINRKLKELKELKRKNSIVVEDF